MSLHFTAQQYDEPYHPNRLRNWTVAANPFPGKFATNCIRRPITFIACDNGHLLPHICRNMCTSPWGDYTTSIWEEGIECACIDMIKNPQDYDRSARGILVSKCCDCVNKKIVREMNKVCGASVCSSRTNSCRQSPSSISSCSSQASQQCQQAPICQQPPQCQQQCSRTPSRCSSVRSSICRANAACSSKSSIATCRTASVSQSCCEVQDPNCFVDPTCKNPNHVITGANADQRNACSGDPEDLCIGIENQRKDFQIIAPIDPYRDLRLISDRVVLD